MTTITGKAGQQDTPDGQPVAVTLPVPDSDDCIVLLEQWRGKEHSFEPFPNLLRCRPDGSVVWRAALPEPAHADAYVGVEWGNEGLEASSWSGYRVLLDPHTGRIVSKAITK